MARVLIAAGASGGHVYPALATAEVLRARGHHVEFAGGDRLEARAVPAAGFAFHPLPSRRPPSVRIELVTPKGLSAMASIGLATVRARSLVKRVRPDVVLGMGGFAAVPVTIAASFGSCALALHEQNAHLSFAQRIPLRRADVVALGLPVEEGVAHRRVELVGNPVRASIAALAGGRAERTAAARERLGLDASRTTLLVAGGSLGSGPLNDVVPTLRLPDDVQVLHLAGKARDRSVRSAWETAGTRAVVLDFLDAMEDAYAAADVIVSRSGGITVAEVAVAGLPAVFVPLETLARGDQSANARFLERAGGARVVAQSGAGLAERLGDAVREVLTDAELRAAMSRASRSVARPDAAERLADVVESVL